MPQMSKRTISLAEAANKIDYYTRFQVTSGSVVVIIDALVGTDAVICASDGNPCRHSFRDHLYHCAKEGCSTAYSMLPEPRQA